MFDWIGDLIAGIGQAISDSLAAAWEMISGSIWETFLSWIYTTIFNALSDFFTMIGNLGANMFDLEWVQATLELFSLFGWGLFVAGLVVCVFDLAIEYQTGRTNIKTTCLNVLKGFLAVNLFTVVPVQLYRFCITLQNIFSHDLSSIFGQNMGSGKTLIDIAGDCLKTLSGLNSLFHLLLMIALGYCVIKIFFSNIKRGGILLIQIAVGSLYMFSIPRGYTDGFTQWCKQVIALCLTAFLQVTLLYLGLMTFTTDMLLGLGIMLSANEVPRIAQQFGLDTSVKINVMSAVHTTTTAVNLTRALAKK